jgi:hypothetical protein
MNTINLKGRTAIVTGGGLAGVGGLFVQHRRGFWNFRRAGGLLILVMWARPPLTKVLLNSIYW